MARGGIGGEQTGCEQDGSGDEDGRRIRGESRDTLIRCDHCDVKC
jgi:hypothetical protein